MFPLLCLLCVTMGLVKTAVAEGNSCHTVDSEAGRCIKLTECPSLYDLMQTLPLPLTQTATEYFQQSFCGFAGKTPMVCCPHMVNGVVTFTKFSSHQNAYLLNQYTCGLSVEPRIARGTEAHINEFPWMALLVYDGGRYLCGGTIITERYVLTAAHCITNDLRRVRIGEHTIATNPDCETVLGKLYCAPPYQELGIEKTIIHAVFSARVMANDIALIRVVSPIDFTVPNAMPVCLPIYQNLLSKNFFGKNLTVTGWGLTETGNKSDVLLKVAVNVISNEACQARYKAVHVPSYIKLTKMCAGTAGQDACQGDSGGPLMYMGAYNKHVGYIQYGIVSYGIWSCGARMPGVYVKVVKYLKWILDHIKP